MLLRTQPIEFSDDQRKIITSHARDMTNWYQEPSYERATTAEETRMKTLEESVRRLDSQMLQIQQSAALNQENIAQTNRRQEEMKQTLIAMKKSIDRNQQEVRNLLDRNQEKSNERFAEMMEMMRGLMDLRRLREVEDRTLYIKIHFEIYSISCEFLGQMFSEMGVVESVDRFNEGDQFHSRVCFRNRDSAIEAINWFYGRCIYDGCCQMELFLGSTLWSHSSSNLGDGVVDEMGAPNQRITEESVGVPQSVHETKNAVPIDVCQEKDSIEVESSIEELNQEIAPNVVLVVPKILVVDDSEVKIEEVPNEPEIQFEFSKVDSYPPNVVVDELAWEGDELVDASIGIRWTDFRMNSSYCVNFPSAHQVFVKMSETSTDGASEHVNGFSKISRDCLKFFVAYKVFAEMPRRNVWNFDPGIAEILVLDPIDSIEVGIADFGENAYKLFEEMPSRGITMIGREYWNFDSGDVGSNKIAGFEQKGSAFVVGQDRFKWDPGGGCLLWAKNWSHYLTVFSKLEGVFGYRIGSTRQDSLFDDISFDRGKTFVRMLDVCFGMVTDKTFVYDPGISK